MWNRETLKRRGKAAMHANYWKCVAVALIVGILASGTLSSGMQLRFNVGDMSISRIIGNNMMGLKGSEYHEIIHEVYSDVPAAAVIGALAATLTALFAIASMLIAIGGVLKIFILNLFEIGGCRFFTQNAAQPASIREVLCAFEGGSYLKSVLTLFLRGLYIGLWSLLLVIPGVVKAYEYRMIPYLLADHPEMDRKAIFSASREMMSGNKWSAFVLDLSFLGWHLLSVLTFGLLSVVFVAPYQNATNAELYLALQHRENNGSEESFH